jgi:transcriptional regulator with XRE-family HTH domain
MHVIDGYGSVMERGNEWSVRIAAAVGQRVAHFREAMKDDRGRKLTAQALADRCAELGLPLGRPTISKLEKGLRQTITVDEVLVLAAALEVAPLLLLFPVGAEETVEVLPGVAVPVFPAARWFTGEQPWPDGTDEAAEAWWRTSFPVVAFRDHARLANDHRFALRGAQNSRQRADRAESEAEAKAYIQSAEGHERTAAEIERQLRSIRKAIRDRTLTPPELASDLEHIDGPNGDAVVPGYALPTSRGFTDHLGKSTP